MKDYFNYYRLVFLCWFVYLLVKCCCDRDPRNQNGEASRTNLISFFMGTDREHQNSRSTDTANGTSNNNNNNNTETEAKRRRDLVRDRLEFRTISAPPPPPRETIERNGGNAEETNGTITDAGTSEVDLESGDTASPSSSSPTAAAKSATNGDNAENDESSDNNNSVSNSNGNSNSVRSLMSKFFHRRSTTNLDGTRTSADGNNEDEDPPTSPTENHFSIASLLHSTGLSGPDAHNHECCSICLDPYAVGDRVARLKKPENHEPLCNHWFHEDCILEWLQNHDECPLCRVNMIQA